MLRKRLRVLRGSSSSCLQIAGRSVQSFASSPGFTAFEGQNFGVFLKLSIRTMEWRKNRTCEYQQQLSVGFVQGNRLVTMKGA